MPGPHTYGRIPFFFPLQGGVLTPTRGVENASPYKQPPPPLPAKEPTHAIT